MGTDLSRVVVIAILFLGTFLSGFGLSHFHRPYNVALLTVHKLLALGAMVPIGVLVVRAYRLAGLSRLEWTPSRFAVRRPAPHRTDAVFPAAFLSGSG